MKVPSIWVCGCLFIDLCLILRYLGIPIRTNIYILGENKAFVDISTRIHAKLHRRYTGLGFHKVNSSRNGWILPYQWWYINPVVFLGPIHSMAHASATSISGGDTINTWSSMGIDFQDKETLKIGVPWWVRDTLPQSFLSRYLVKIQCGLTFYDNQCPMLVQEDKIFQHQMHKWSFAVYVDWIRKSIHISLRGNQIHKFCHNHNE